MEKCITCYEHILWVVSVVLASRRYVRSHLPLVQICFFCWPSVLSGWSRQWWKRIDKHMSDLVEDITDDWASFRFVACCSHWKPRFWSLPTTVAPVPSSAPRSRRCLLKSSFFSFSHWIVLELSTHQQSMGALLQDVIVSVSGLADQAAWRDKAEPVLMSALKLVGIHRFMEVSTLSPLSSFLVFLTGSGELVPSPTDSFLGSATGCCWLLFHFGSNRPEESRNMKFLQWW